MKIRKNALLASTLRGSWRSLSWGRNSAGRTMGPDTTWGKNDKIFPADGAHPYKHDLPDVEFHLIDTGHFALEDKADEMVPLIRDFLNRKVAPQ